MAETVTAAPDNPYTPPACVPGVPFIDVTCTTGFDPWIEQFGADGISAGCGGGKYCPGTPVTRDQMAVFIEKAIRGTLAWSPGDLGNSNTGLGREAMLVNGSGAYNTGVGNSALFNNSSGANNTAVGAEALGTNTSASQNTAVGSSALISQSYDPGSPWPSDNTAVGYNALANDQPTTTGNGIQNTAVGSQALQQNTTGYGNTASGYQTLFSDDTGVDNTASGYQSLYSNTSGAYNTASGEAAGSSNSTGNWNTFLGAFSDANANNLDDATAIGYDALVDASNHVRIGDLNVTQIGGQVAWSNLSDARAKTDIRDLDLGLDFVMALRPVSFMMQHGNGRTDMGFVAQDVEVLLGDDYNVLGIGGDKDRTLSLRYTDLMAPVVKAIQEQQGTIERQQAQITDQAKTIQAQRAQLDALKTSLVERDRALEHRLAALELGKQ